MLIEYDYWLEDQAEKNIQIPFIFPMVSRISERNCVVLFNNYYMRRFWKDIITIINTACIGALGYYEYCHDCDASVITGLAIFVVSLSFYLLLRDRRKRHRYGK